MDLHSSGAILRILALMAMADGVLTTEEESMLDRLGRDYLRQSELKSWEQAFGNPMDLTQVARGVAIADRPLAAKLAYMVISASREDFGFPVNTAERQAFDQLTQALDLTQHQKDQAIQDATRDLARRSGFWDVLINTFSNQFMLDTDLNPIAPSN